MEQVVPETLVDKAFSRLGLSEPGMRFMTTFAAVSALMVAIKPGYSFGKDGRPLAAQDPHFYVPWWAPGFALGFIAATLI